MSALASPVVWEGKYNFWVSGTERREDTLWIEANYGKPRKPLRLVLPTLCITYADMQFANDIGGVQENYPHSIAYGARFFEPAVEIVGEEAVRKFTWIRGAHRVVIGASNTEIEWLMSEPLVIPRLHIERNKRFEALFFVDGIEVGVERPLEINVVQYADGRNIGGVRIEKRHPKWTPAKQPTQYDLRIKVEDARTRTAIEKAEIRLLRWSQATGRLTRWETFFTDERGYVDLPDRPSGQLESATLYRPGWHATARCFRPLPGQRVLLSMRAWRLKDSTVPYVWKKDLPLKDLARMTGHRPSEILDRNGLVDVSDLRPGMRIKLPCYAATYRLEPKDTLEWLASAFTYPSVAELAKFNGLIDPTALRGDVDIRLPGWHFFYARPGDSLAKIDDMFDLPPGCARTVGRAAHPHPGQPFPLETIAIPSKEFVRSYITANPD